MVLWPSEIKLALSPQRQHANNLCKYSTLGLDRFLFDGREDIGFIFTHIQIMWLANRSLFRYRSPAWQSAILALAARGKEDGCDLDVESDKALKCTKSFITFQ